MFGDKVVVRRILFFLRSAMVSLMNLCYLEEKANETSSISTKSISQTDGREDLRKGNQRSRVEISVLCCHQVVLCSPRRERLMENFENE